MRVLHLLKSNKYSGAENVVLTIMDACPDIEMIYASTDGPIRKVVEDSGHRFYPLEDTSVRTVVWKVIFGTVRVYNCDVPKRAFLGCYNSVHYV